MVLLMICTARLSYAKPMGGLLRPTVRSSTHRLNYPADFTEGLDTLKVKKVSNETDDKNKVKEIPKAKKQAKPQKLGAQPADSLNKKDRLKLMRQRRPEGLERPPEIPRRNNN